MFDLKEQISKWRDNLAASQTLGMSDIDELESHLQEEIESLKSAKLSDEEAFMIAARRLGSPARLTDEFAKINRGGPFRHGLSWMITGILAYVLATQFIALVKNVFIWFASFKEVRGYSLGFVALACDVAILGVAISVCYFLWCFVQRSARFRKWARQLTARLILLVMILVFLVVEVAAKILLPVMVFRVLGPLQYGQATQVFAWTQLAWSIVIPVILVIVLIKHVAVNSRKAETE